MEIAELNVRVHKLLEQSLPVAVVLNGKSNVHLVWASFDDIHLEIYYKQCAVYRKTYEKLISIIFEHSWNDDIFQMESVELLKEFGSIIGFIKTIAH